MATECTPLAFCSPTFTVAVLPAACVTKGGSKAKMVALAGDGAGTVGCGLAPVSPAAAGAGFCAGGRFADDGGTVAGGTVCALACGACCVCGFVCGCTGGVTGAEIGVGAGWQRRNRMELSAA